MKLNYLIMKCIKPIAYLLQLVFAAIIFLFLIPIAPLSAQEQPTVTPAPTTNPREIEIVGGQPAEPGEWPWQVMVRPGGYLCGGTLIAADWVVTAAHCVYDNGELFAPTSVSVKLGEYDRTVRETSEQTRSVSQIIAHEEYDERNNNNDIALLQLSSPAIMNEMVASIGLVSTAMEGSLASTGSDAFVTGWGTTAEGGNAATKLMEVSVPIVSNTQCNRSYGIITDNMLCAGYENGGKDSCQGDSGGPLVIQDSQGVWQLAGVVSFGYGCARADFYGVYTRVSRYENWIREHVGAAPDMETPVATKTAVTMPTKQPTQQPTLTLTPTAPPSTQTPMPTKTVTKTPGPLSTPTVSPTRTVSPTPTVSPTKEPSHFAVTLEPSEEASLSYESSLGSIISVTVPAGAVNEIMTLTFDIPSVLAAQVMGTQVMGTQATKLQLAKRVLQLTVYRETLALTNFLFQEPFEITLLYVDEEIKGITEDTLELAIYDFATDSWTTDGITQLKHDLDDNYLVVEATRTGIYALVAPNRFTFLPLVQR